MLNRCVSVSLRLVFCLSLLVIPRIVFAHPHVWVDYYVEAVSGPGGIQKLKFRWHFDDMFTSMVMEDFHIHKQTLAAADMETIRKNAFSNLKNYHYYTNIKFDGQDFNPQDISDFTAELSGKNIEYSFTINLPQAAKTVEVSLFDPEFYVDIGPPLLPASADKPGIMSSAKMQPKDFISSSAENGAKPSKCEWKMGEPRISASWGKFATFMVRCEAQ